MARPLIATGARRTILTLIIVAVALVAVLAGLLWHGRNSGLDAWVWRELVAHVDGHRRYQLLRFSDPIYTTSLAGVAVLGALAARRWSLLVLAVAGPLVSLLVTEAVLKPLVSRDLGPVVSGMHRFAAVSGSFPSGHETAVASTAVVLAVAAGQLRPPRIVWVLIGIVLAVWLVAAAIGLVRSFYHYATDIVGAWGVSVAVVLALALLIDGATARRR